MNNSMNFAVRARKLGKRYLVPAIQQDAEYQTLSEQLGRMAAAPFRWFDRKVLRQAVQSDNQDWFWALNDLDFDIEHGEIVGVIGRNGNGKSTLLKILSRITAPTTGYADLRGRICSLLEVGTGFHPELTGAENIFLNGSILGMTRKEIQKKYDAIVAFSEVERFLHMPVKRYSSGMRVRLAFSVAAHLDPDILIIDEVLAVGDLAFQKKCLTRMNEVARSGRTILFVSHNMPAIESLCKRTIWLSKGRIHMDGPTAQVVPHFVQALSKLDNAHDSSEIDLTSHANRSLHSRPVLTKLSLRNGQEELANVFALGSAVVLDLAYDPKEAPSGLAFGVKICSENGQPLIHLHSRVHSKLVTEDSTAGQVRCTIPELPLLPGEYRIDLAVGTWAEEWDSIESATRFRVEASDYYRTGELPNGVDGPLAVRSHWTGLSAKSYSFRLAIPNQSDALSPPVWNSATPS